MLNEIFRRVSPLWGVCSYSKIQDRLIPCRAAARIPAGAESAVMFCFPYLLEDDKYTGLNISRYAAVPDYHTVVMKRLEACCEELKTLFPGNEFVPFADNSPVPEVEAACLAGLGVRGENSLLITEKYGSYVFIGEIVTDLFIESENNAAGKCLSCGKCSEACPGGALTGNGINKELCLSHITQKKGELSESEKKLIKGSGCLWGCDICQTVCPMNKNAGTTFIEEFISGAVPCLDESTDISGRAFEWRGRKVTDRNIGLFRGNEDAE